MPTIEEFRPVLEILRAEGVSGSEAVRRLTSRGVADKDAPHLIAAFIIENRAARRQAEEAAQRSNTKETRIVSSLPKTVTIETGEYLELVESGLKLTQLEHAGVDNWDGHDELDWAAIRAGVEKAKAALTNVASQAVNPDDYREHTDSGWYFRFPNRWTASVIRQARNPFHFEPSVGVGADADQFAVEHDGNPDGVIHHLTSGRAEEIVRELAAMPHRTTDDINGN